MSTPFQPSPMVQVEENLLNRVYQRVSACKDKTQLKMSIGDPTFDGNLVTSTEAVQAWTRVLQEPKHHGYITGQGHPEARKAVVEYWGRRFAWDNTAHLHPEDVVLTCGGSEAILATFAALAEEGDNLLLPAPGFAHYAFVCDIFKIQIRYYHLKASTGWEVDLEEIKSLVDDRTKGVLFNNPSNPCGSNWSLSHVTALTQLCETLKLVIIADEIYSGMNAPSQPFHSFANLSTVVPRFIISGTAKMLMAPGWRLGWVMMMDEQNLIKALRDGVKTTANMSLGPNVIAQRALPSILRDTPDSYYAACWAEIESNAQRFTDAVNQHCTGLSCKCPQGALYSMVEIDLRCFPTFETDVDLYMALEDEENVQVVPGTYMGSPGFLRVCITRPASIIEEVTKRLQQFCTRHAKAV